MKIFIYVIFFIILLASYKPLFGVTTRDFKQFRGRNIVEIIDINAREYSHMNSSNISNTVGSDNLTLMYYTQSMNSYIKATNIYITIYGKPSLKTKTVVHFFVNKLLISIYKYKKYVSITYRELK